METIENDLLANVNGGVVDRGDGQGCTPSPFPPPRPPVIDPPIDGSVLPGTLGGSRPGMPTVGR